MYVYLTSVHLFLYETFALNCYQMRTKLKHKERFKISTQRKGEAQQYKSEHFQNSDKWM